MQLQWHCTSCQNLEFLRAPQGLPYYGKVFVVFERQYFMAVMHCPVLNGHGLSWSRRDFDLDIKGLSYLDFVPRVFTCLLCLFIFRL